MSLAQWRAEVHDLAAVVAAGGRLSAAQSRRAVEVAQQLLRCAEGARGPDGVEGEGSWVGGDSSPYGTAGEVASPEEILTHQWNQQHHRRSPIEILWHDAQSFAWAWEEPEPCYPAAATLSIGYPVHVDDHTLSVVSLVNPHTWGHGITIPRGCVHTIRVLR